MKLAMIAGIIIACIAIAGVGSYLLLKPGTGPTSSENQPPVGPSPDEGITVQSIDSTYRIASGGTSGWFHTGQDVDIMLSGVDFDNTGGSLLLNHPMDIATDGTHLLLADTRNNRVLIWNSPPTGNTPPDMVLGQNNFYANNPGTGKNQMNWPVSISTDGQRVVVADTNNDRILIWNTFPTTSGQPADLVIEGVPRDPMQASNPSHIKRVIEWPWGVWTNGEKLVVSSTSSGTVLIWNSFPTQDNQPADVYLGGNFLGTPRNITSDGVRLIIGDHNPKSDGVPLSHAGTFFWSSFPTTDNQPYYFYMDEPYDPNGWMRGDFTPDGKLVLFGVRLHIWNSFPTGGSDSPDVTVGESYYFEWGDGSNVKYANGRLYICLSNGNKIVGFNSLPTSSDATPDFAIGAPDINTNTLETNYIITNPNPMSDGTSLFVPSDFDGKLYVWKNLPDESGAWPDFVYNLPFAPWDGTLFENILALAGKDRVLIWDTLPRNGELPTRQFEGGIGSATFINLTGVALDGRYFYLADRDANKVYIWEGIPDNAADPVFTLDVEWPTRLSTDGTYLAVAATEASFDRRVLFFEINELSSSSQGITLTGIRVNLPQQVMAVGGHLFIADTGYNRVLVWRDISDAAAGDPPEVVLGAEDFEETTAEIGIDKLFMPGAVSFDGDYLWVGEFKFSGRILRFSPS